MGLVGTISFSFFNMYIKSLNKRHDLVRPELNRLWRATPEKKKRGGEFSTFGRLSLLGAGTVRDNVTSLLLLFAEHTHPGSGQFVVQHDVFLHHVHHHISSG